MDWSAGQPEPIGMGHILALFTRVSPVRYIMSIMRGVFLKGATLADVKWDLLLLLVIGAATFSLATLRFQKRLS